MGECPSLPPKKRERKQLADLRKQLAEVNAKLKTRRAKRDKLLKKKRVLKGKIGLLDPDYEPPRYQTWGRWSMAPGHVRFYCGRGGNYVVCPPYPLHSRAHLCLSSSHIL
jgi:hypothetical protein